MLLYIAPVFLPLVGAAIAGLLGKFIGDRLSEILSCLAMGLAAISAVVIFNNVIMQLLDVCLVLLLLV